MRAASVRIEPTTHLARAGRTRTLSPANRDNDAHHDGRCIPLRLGAARLLKTSVLMGTVRHLHYAGRGHLAICAAANRRPLGLLYGHGPESRPPVPAYAAPEIRPLAPDHNGGSASAASPDPPSGCRASANGHCRRYRVWPWARGCVRGKSTPDQFWLHQSRPPLPHEPRPLQSAPTF